jgi:hypothetical protein
VKKEMSTDSGIAASGPPIVATTVTLDTIPDVVAIQDVLAVQDVLNLQGYNIEGLLQVVSRYDFPISTLL